MKVEEFIEAKIQSSFERAAERQKTEEAVKSNIEQTQKKQKERYDLKRGAASCFDVGSVFLKKEETQRGQAGLPVARVICDQCITWQRPTCIQVEGA